MAVVLISQVRESCTASSKVHKAVIIWHPRHSQALLGAFVSLPLCSKDLFPSLVDIIWLESIYNIVPRNYSTNLVESNLRSLAKQSRMTASSCSWRLGLLRERIESIESHSEIYRISFAVPRYSDQAMDFLQEIAAWRSHVIILRSDLLAVSISSPTSIDFGVTSHIWLAMEMSAFSDGRACRASVRPQASLQNTAFGERLRFGITRA